MEKYDPGKLERLSRGIARKHLPPPLSDGQPGLHAAFLKEFESRKKALCIALRAEAWPEPLTAEFLVERYPQDKDRIDSSAVVRACIAEEQIRYDLDRVRSEFFTLAWMHLEEKIAARTYRPCPLVQYDDSSLWPDGVYPGNDFAMSVLCKGWIVNLELYKGEFPDVHELRKELEELGKSRERRVWQALKQDS